MLASAVKRKTTKTVLCPGKFRELELMNFNQLRYINQTKYRSLYLVVHLTSESFLTNQLSICCVCCGQR